MFLCEYIRVQYTVNWFLLWSSLIWVLSDSQGWLILASTPYRSSLDSVTVDGKQWLPWLRSLCVSVYPKNGLTLPEGGVHTCVCLSAWVSVCALVCFDLTEMHPWRECNKLREEPARQMVRANGKGRWGGKVRRSWGILYQLTEDTELPALTTRTSVCASCARDVTPWEHSEWLVVCSHTLDSYHLVSLWFFNIFFYVGGMFISGRGWERIKKA